MQEICHRCGGELSTCEPEAKGGRSPFCPHCGAPQLLLSSYTEPLSTGADAINPLAEGSTGTLPPPRPNQIDWRMALRSAAIVSLVAAVLSAIAARLPNVSAISTISSIWIISASLTTLALYQRGRPLATMNAGVGARIGILVGVLLVFCLGATLSAVLVVARYGLHTMSGFDADAAKGMKSQIAQIAATRPIPSESLALINSPQFRTTVMLTFFAVVLCGVLLISIFGGAVGGLLRTRRFSTGK